MSQAIVAVHRRHDELSQPQQLGGGVLTACLAVLQLSAITGDPPLPAPRRTRACTAFMLSQDPPFASYMTTCDAAITGPCVFNVGAAVADPADADAPRAPRLPSLPSPPEIVRSLTEQLSSFTSKR